MSRRKKDPIDSALDTFQALSTDAQAEFLRIVARLQRVTAEVPRRAPRTKPASSKPTVEAATG